VQKRYGKDGDFIISGDKSTEAVRNWSRDIFQHKDFLNIKLSKNVWEWFLEVVLRAYAKAESDLIRRMILVKIIHTREVVRAGDDITLVEKNEKWNKYTVGAVCLLHDIARFEQALLGSYSDTKTGYDHALAGAKMIKAHDFDDFERFGVLKEDVVEAVKHHSEYQYTGENVYAKLTRDADKLALLRAMPEILEAKIGGFAEEGVSEAALQSYKNREMVRHADMKTKADLFLAWLAWEIDFNYDETKRLFISEGIKEWMTGELKKRGVLG